MANHIETISGIKFSPVTAAPDDIRVEDIAHALSLLCRFVGHITQFYSVAQHSVIVARILERDGHSPKVVFAGLLHDAHEAYMGDMASPLKRLFPEFEVISDRLQGVIHQKFDLTLTPEEAAAVKRADHIALHAEVRDLKPLANWQWPDDLKEWKEAVDGLSPEAARKFFLKTFERLVDKAKSVAA